MQSWHQGTIFAIGTALCWTISSISFESASRRVGSLVVNLIRLIIAIGFMCLWNWQRRGLAWPSDASRDTWLWLSLSGVVGFFVGDMALFRAFVLMGARLSSLLMSLAPPMAALIGYLWLDERISLVGWIGMITTLGGIVWVMSERIHEEGAFGEKIHSESPGNLVSATSPLTPSLSPAGRGGNPRALRRVTKWALTLGVIAALGQAVGIVLSKRGLITPTGMYDPVAATQIRALAASVGFAAVIVFSGFVPKLVAALRRPDAMAIMTLGALAGPFAGVSLLMAAIQFVPTGVAQTITATVPVMIIPFVIVLYHEHVTWRAVFGAVVTVIGVGILVHG